MGWCHFLPLDGRGRCRRRAEPLDLLKKRVRSRRGGVKRLRAEVREGSVERKAPEQSLITLQPERTRTRIAHTPKSRLSVMPNTATAPPLNTAAATSAIGLEDDLMDFCTNELKKRQNENGGGRKSLIKHK